MDPMVRHTAHMHIGALGKMVAKKLALEFRIIIGGLKGRRNERFPMFCRRPPFVTNSTVPSLAAAMAAAALASVSAVVGPWLAARQPDKACRHRRRAEPNSLLRLDMVCARPPCHCRVCALFPHVANAEPALRWARAVATLIEVERSWAPASHAMCVRLGCHRLTVRMPMA